MSGIVDSLPRRLSRLQFNLLTVIVAALAITVGVLMAEQSIELVVKPIVLIAIGIHHWSILRRHDDMSVSAKTGRVYSWVLSVVAAVWILMSIRLSITSVQGFNYAMIGCYIVYLFLMLPVVISCSLRSSAPESSVYQDDASFVRKAHVQDEANASFSEYADTGESNLFVQRTQEGNRTRVVMKKIAVFQWLSWPAIISTIIAAVNKFEGPSLTIAFLVWVVAIAAAVPYWKISREIMQIGKATPVAFTGSRYSFSNPPTYEWESQL